MNKSKTLKRFLYKECDFDFDFSEIHREWSLDSLIKAMDTGQPLHDTCLHLGLDVEHTEKLVKYYSLQAIYEEQRHLSPRQIELMNQYHDHTLFGHSLGEILEKLMYLDPQAWLQTFENSILYLNDEIAAEKGGVSTSSLSADEQTLIVERLFGRNPLTFDNPENTDGFDMNKIRQEWSEHGSKSGAAFLFFKKYLKQDQFLHPHPNDILVNNRRTRILKQYRMFQSILKDVSFHQEIAGDLRNYESELHTAYVNYTSAKIEAAGLLDLPSQRRKGEAIVKLTALFTLVKSPELRILLFDNLVKEPGNPPFNFADEKSKPGLNYEDIEVEMLDYEEAREWRAALYLTIIFTAELTLKAFVKDKLREASVYFGTTAMDSSQIADPGEEEELLQLKRNLILVVLMQKRQNVDPSSLFATKPYTLDTEPYKAASDRTFASVYQWVYNVNKAYTAGSLFPEAWKQLSRRGSHRAVSTAGTLVESLAPFDEAFKHYARIKPEDLGAVDIEKFLKEI